MRAVGIKQLKARLSEYLRLVKSGETILVTERETVIAELRPSHRQRRTPASIEAVIDGLAESGELVRASASKQGWLWAPRGLGLSPKRAQELLDDLRDDR
jgi:antitoxin (DNA-binding transcriptional repressor) of toxin-antitoxin stability system